MVKTMRIDTEYHAKKGSRNLKKAFLLLVRMKERIMEDEKMLQYRNRLTQAARPSRTGEHHH